MYNYVGLPHIYYPIIQNKYLTLQTGCMLASFSVLVEQMIYRDRNEVTYNDARDMYASMEQHIQPLNSKNKINCLC